MDRRNDCIRLQEKLAGVCRHLRALDAIDSYTTTYVECGSSYYFDFAVNIGGSERHTVSASNTEELDDSAVARLKLYLQGKVAEAMNEARKRGDEAQRRQQELQEVQL